MKILITGSSGFIGYSLSKRLLELGHEVTGIDNHNDYYSTQLKEARKNELLDKKIDFLLLDLNDLDKLKGNFDIAINFAAQAGVRVPKKHQKKYEDSNIIGFKSFYSFCISRKIKKIIFASSSSVYCDQLSTKFREDQSTLKPKSFYGETKLFNEEYAKKKSIEYDIDTIGLRFFSVYGPYGRPDMAYYKFAKAILLNKEIKLFNKGKMSRDMTYIDDIVDGILLSLKRISANSRKEKYEIFNLGRDNPISTLELLKIIEKKLGKKSNIKHFQSFQESSFTHANLDKSRKFLGYNPIFKIDEGIENFLEWLLIYEGTNPKS